MKIRCKFCGSPEVSIGIYECGSVDAIEFAQSATCWNLTNGEIIVWSQGITCRDRCEQVRLQHEETIEILKAREANTVEALRGHIEQLEKRIAKTTEAAQQANRINLLTVRNGRASAQVCSDGCYAWASVLDDIVSILQGNTPENQESST